LTRRRDGGKVGRMRRVLVVLLALLLTGCTPSKSAAPKRVQIEELGAAEVKFIPAESQPPYCLIFTVSEKGVVRQLTMTAEKMSIPCEGGKPIGGVVYRIPPAEGKIRAHVIFSDRKLDASPMARQVHELAAQNPKFMALDLRAPGQVMIETLEFTPMLEGEGFTIQADSTPEDAGGKPASAPSARP
jgi:hypothetical protein